METPKRKRLDAVIDADVHAKALKDAENDNRSLSNHVETLLKNHKPKSWTPKKEYDK